jgi:hypothetical protein
MTGRGGGCACSSRSYSRAKRGGDGPPSVYQIRLAARVCWAPACPRRVHGSAVTVRGNSTSGDAIPRSSGPADSPGGLQKPVCRTRGRTQFSGPTEAKKPTQVRWLRAKPIYASRAIQLALRGLQQTHTHRDIHSNTQNTQFTKMVNRVSGALVRVLSCCHTAQSTHLCVW